MKRILVAGSTGYLSGFVCQELKSRGHFVRALARSPEKLAPLRDSLDEVVEMACRGRVWLIGSGTNRVNPIHGADLTVVCADAIESVDKEIAVRGPQVMTWREVAQPAFDVLDQQARVTCIPVWLMWSVVRLIRLFNRHQGELLAFFTTMATTDVVAPETGTRALEQHFLDTLHNEEGGLSHVVRTR